MQHIKEFYGQLHPGDGLFEKLQEEYNEHIKMCENENCAWHHIVYLEQNHETEIIYFSASPDKHEMKRPFAECLKMIDCRDFNQILMLLTLFPWHTGKRQLKKILAPPKEPLAPPDLLLANTNGWILYRQQLEMLVQLAMKINATEAKKVRKEYNAGKPEAYALFEKYDLFGEKLSAMIRTRCITRIVHESAIRMKGAVLLHAYLTEKPELTG